MASAGMGRGEGYPCGNFLVSTITKCIFLFSPFHYKAGAQLTISLEKLAYNITKTFKEDTLYKVFTLCFFFFWEKVEKISKFMNISFFCLFFFHVRTIQLRDVVVADSIEWYFFFFRFELISFCRIYHVYRIEKEKYFQRTLTRDEYPINFNFLIFFSP